MSKKLTTEEFIKRAKEVHGNKYDYSLVDYKNIDTKVKIICPEHGVFEQIPYSHLKRQGCSACGKEKLSMLFSFSQKQFIDKAKEVHGDKYDYSLVDYKNCGKKVKVICSIHGVFEQLSSNHLRGHGCPKCACDFVASKRRLTTERFIEKANQIHNNKYDYSLVNYKKAKEKVKIICPAHGIFEQTSDAHLRGQGCPICNESHGERKINKWLNDNGYSLNKDYFREFSFKDLKSKNNVCLRFDFYVPKKNLLIEYQGEQHYKSFDFAKKKRCETEKFYSLQENDQLKRNFCKERNIKELEIIFSEYENIESILKEALK